MISLWSKVNQFHARIDIQLYNYYYNCFCSSIFRCRVPLFLYVYLSVCQCVCLYFTCLSVCQKLSVSRTIFLRVYFQICVSLFFNRVPCLLKDIAVLIIAWFILTVKRIPIRWFDFEIMHGKFSSSCQHTISRKSLRVIFVQIKEWSRVSSYLTVCMSCVHLLCDSVSLSVYFSAQMLSVIENTNAVLVSRIQCISWLIPISVFRVSEVHFRISTFPFPHLSFNSKSRLRSILLGVFW